MLPQVKTRSLPTKKKYRLKRSTNSSKDSLADYQSKTDSQKNELDLVNEQILSVK